MFTFFTGLEKGERIAYPNSAANGKSGKNCVRAHNFRLLDMATREEIQENHNSKGLRQQMYGRPKARSTSLDREKLFLPSKHLVLEGAADEDGNPHTKRPQRASDVTHKLVHKQIALTQIV